jgi:hypothetical protein
LTYSSTRIGAYEVLLLLLLLIGIYVCNHSVLFFFEKKQTLSPMIREKVYDGKPMPFFGKVLLSCSAGVAGGIVGVRLFINISRLVEIVKSARASIIVHRRQPMLLI